LKKNKKLWPTSGNISVGGDEQLARFAIPIKFLTAERKAISNAARKYTAAVGGNCKKHRQFQID